MRSRKLFFHAFSSQKFGLEDLQPGAVVTRYPYGFILKMKTLKNSQARLVQRIKQGFANANVAETAE
jgi:hypothetical protein